MAAFFPHELLQKLLKLYSKFHSFSVCLCLSSTDFHLQSQVYPNINKCIYCQFILGVLICIKHTKSSTLHIVPISLLSRSPLFLCKVKVVADLKQHVKGCTVAFFLNVDFEYHQNYTSQIQCSRIPFLSTS